MTRRRKSNHEELLTHLVGVRFSEKDYRKLLTLMHNSNARSIGELVRRIIIKDKILLYLKDDSLNGVSHELVAIKREFNAIGTNINQITHAFHIADTATQKTFHALQVGTHYTKVGEKVDHLLAVIADLGKKWQALPSDKKLRATILLRDLVASASVT